MNASLPTIDTHIWVIDDDESMRWVLEKTLKNNGYKVSTCESGSVALTRFKRTAPIERPHLIMTDVRMPGINGFELLRQIKHISPQTPIIFMTAYTDLDSTIRGFSEGAYEYLSKPFDIDEALALVASAVESRSKSTNVDSTQGVDVGDWQEPLRHWAKQQLARGENEILKQASKVLEKTLLDCALEATRGRKQNAARRLGWGRNTLTRKLRELN